MCYIGKCVYGRKNSWETYLGSGVYLKRAIKKYGVENFTREILEEAPDEISLRLLEEEYIAKYNAVEDEMFYNLKESSIGGDTFTYNPNKEAIREKKSLKAKGILNSQYGKEKTEVFFDKVKKANSREVEIDGILYTSMTQASKALNLGITTLAFRLDSDGFPTYIRKRPKNKNTKKIIDNKPKRVHINGVEYPSISAASFETGYSKTKIVKRVGFDKNYFYIE